MKCFKCNEKIENQNYIKADGKNFHKECFVCEYCGKNIKGTFNVSEGKYYHNECYINYIRPRCKKCGLVINNAYIKDDEGFYYHPDCYKQEVLPICSVCGKYIEEKYYIDKWGNNAHIYHGKIKTKLCNSCGRIISYKTSNNGVEYNDGRTICGICDLSAVKNDSKILKAKHKILALLKEKGINKIPENVPIHLADKKMILKMGNNSVSEDSYGLTLTNVKTKNKDIVSQIHSIYILYGLPEIEFEGVLAHELLHVWINERQIKIKGKDLEGFCNLGSAFVYQSYKTKHSEILLEKMYENKDKIYGDGFRKIMKIYEKEGIEGVFEFIKIKKN